ncbi:MAG TPA: ABC transporter permease subunit [Thermoanaerobaculia bacterium]|nr:ABC transporter permease subunit [Thermoanaerobaculia bacterium]
MLRAIAKKEMLNHLRSFRFWAGALLSILLAALSTVITAPDYNLRLRSYEERVAGERRELRSVSTYSYLQPLLVRPPERLSILDQGLEPRLGTEVAINLFSIPVEATGEPRGNEFLASLPALDLTLVVSLVLGLLALLLTCDSITSEKEEGTLRAILANGMPRWAVLVGKLAGNLATIALPLGGALLVSLAISNLVVQQPLTLDQWLRVAGLAGSYVAYLSLMLLCGLLISLYAPGTSQALGVSVLLGFGLTIIIPGAAWAAANGLSTKSRAERLTEQRIEALTVEYERRLAEEFKRSGLRSVPSGYRASSFASGPNRAVRYRNGAAAYYDALAAYYRFEAASGIRYAAEALALRRHDLGQLRSGERLGAALGALSPATILYGLSEPFAGTSIAEYDRFITACQGYRLQFVAYLETKGAFQSWRWFTDDSPGQLHPWPGYFGLTPEQVSPQQVSLLFSRLTEPAVAARAMRDQETIANDRSRPLALRDLPPFSYRPDSFSGSLRRGAANAVAFLLLDALAVTAAVARFRRYELD